MRGVVRKPRDSLVSVDIASAGVARMVCINPHCGQRAATL